jgi:hypothetical protein
MVNKNKILDEVEKTLHSFDKDIILEENPFLLTRIMAERENRLHKPKKRFTPAFSFTKVIMILILLINLITVVYYYSWNSNQILQQKLVSQLRKDFQIDQSQNNF